MKIDYQLKLFRRRRQYKPDNDLPFASGRSMHMFLMNYRDGEWQDPRIVPYKQFKIWPGAKALHYGQEFFEGIKAFKHDDGELYTFRVDQNAKRANHSADLLCMPNIPVEDQIQAIHALLDVDRLCYPDREDHTMYIRPFMFGDADELYPHPSSTYTYCVFLSPSGPYFPGGQLEPKTFMVTKKYKRVAAKSTGTAKAGGHYANSMLPTKIARDLGAFQVLYLDHNDRYLEEAGSSNHFHVLKDGTIIIPEFTDSILESITSRSVLELAATGDYGIQARQERIRFDDFLLGIMTGDIIEAGTLGTAASITPVSRYITDDERFFLVGDGHLGEITKHLYEKYTGVQWGRLQAPDGWLFKVERH